MDIYNIEPNVFYFDDDAVGLQPKTSHPRFVEHFSHSFYYDCADEEAPFGSDTGFDVLMSLSESVKREGKLSFADFPKDLIESVWKMKYIPVDSLCRDNIMSILKLNEIDVIQSDIVTCAVAFGQIKITGGLDTKLKECAVDSIKRRIITARLLGWGESKVLYQMRDDLSSFKNCFTLDQ